MVDLMPSESGKIEFVRVSQSKYDSSADNLFEKTFFNDKMASSTQAIMSESMSTGQINSMDVPTDWVKRDGVHLRAGAGLDEYHPAGNNDVRLNSFYRGQRISFDAAKAFKDCLSNAPHQIAKGSDELTSLSEVLNDRSRNFNVTQVYTEILNGKKVLIVEGAYKDAEHTTSKTIYVDSDGTGSAIQEISYTAPGALYKAHLPAAENALKSITWK